MGHDQESNEVKKSLLSRCRRAGKKLFRVFGTLVLCGCNMSSSESSQDYAALRKAMVEQQIVARGIKNTKVIEAMLEVERHRFVPPGRECRAYEDSALAILYNQTISQPYIVAFMTETLQLQGDEKVLEIGTGSGYQAAILAEIVKEVYTVEIVEPLAQSAQRLLGELGYANIRIRCGDGYQGWPEFTPFDAIIVTCSPAHIPQPIKEQLKVGGKMIIPVGEQWDTQQLFYLEKTGPDKIVEKAVLEVRFVPMTGNAEKK